MNEPVGLATPSAPVSAASSRDFWCRTPTRFVLFFLHLALLIAAISIAPREYGFELGEAIGLILIFGCLFSWAVLYHAESRTLVGIFVGVAIAQLAFIVFVGLHLRSGDKALREVVAEAVKLREQDAGALAPFSMDRLFEICSGTRPASQQELVELRLRAQRGRAKVQELESTHKQWLEQMVARLRSVSPTVARQFRAGAESRQTESDESAKISRDYFSKAEQLTAFLIDHRHRYHSTPKGLVFDKAEDAQSFNQQIDSMVELQKQLQEYSQKTEQRFKQVQQ